MKRKLRYFLPTCFVLLFFNLNLFSQNQTFKVGEKIVYDVIAEVKELKIKGKVGILKAEVLAITNIKGVYAYHLYANVYSTGASKMIYEVNDVFEAWVTTNTFQPMRIVKQVSEGDWKNRELSIFYPEEGYFLYYDKRVSGEEVKISGLSFDALTLVYFMRFLDKKETKTFTCNWLEGKKIKRDINFKIEKGPLIDSILSKSKIPTYRIRESDKYGTDALISVDYNQLPIDVIIAEQQTYGLNLRVRGVLKEYKEGK